MQRRQFAFAAVSCLGGIRSLSLDAQENRSDPITVGVIGHTGRGDFGHGLDTVWRHFPQTTVKAVADANPDGLARELRKLGLNATDGYSDYRTMLREVRPQVVAVCPRHVDQHCEMILASVAAGVKGIYVEKPFVQTPKQVDQVARACRQQGTKLAVAHRNRYHPVLKTIDQLISDDRIGRLLEIRGRGKGDHRGGAEDLWVLGSHVLNLMTYFGGKPETCSATLYRDGRRVEKRDRVVGEEGLGWLAGNELHARYRFSRGVTGYFDSIANDQTRNFGFGLALVGSQGTIQIWCDDSPLARFLPGNPFEPVGSRPSLPISTAGIDEEEPVEKLHQKVHHHVLPVEDLLAAVAGNREPICGPDDAGMTVEMICGAFQSHRLGRMVTFPLIEREHPFLNYR